VEVGKCVANLVHQLEVSDVEHVVPESVGRSSDTSVNSTVPFRILVAEGLVHLQERALARDCSPAVAAGLTVRWLPRLLSSTAANAQSALADDIAIRAEHLHPSS